MWKFWKKSVAAPVVVRVDPPKLTGLKVSAEALAYARGGEAARNPYVVAVPPPGVLPAGVPTMATDDAISSQYAYASQNWDGLDSVAWPGYAILAQLAQRPEYRRMSEIRAQEMTRKWVKLYSTGDDDLSDRIAAIEAEMKRLHVRDIFRRAAEIDGLFGRAQIYVDTGDSDNPAELKLPLIINKAKISRGKLKRLTIVEPIWTYPNDYNSTQPLKPGFYKPKSWYVNGVLIDGTRLLTIVSREMPDILKPAYSFGGLSLSQMAQPYVDNWLRTRQSVSDLLHSFSTMVLSTDMSSMLSPGSAALLNMRSQLFNANRDNSGLMVVDKETEQLTNVTTSLGTLDALQAQSQEQMASVSATPIVKLLGITPAGLNASADGEIRVFYDSIEATQQEIFSDPLRVILAVIQLSLFGDIAPTIDFTFEPLWSLDDGAKAILRKANADTASVYIADGVMHPIEERARLAAEDGGLYNGLDVEDVPEPPADPAEQPPGEEDDADAEPAKPDADAVPAGDAQDADFVEGDHPRGEGGQFGSGGGGAAAKPAKGESKATANPRPALSATRGEGKNRTMADGSALPAHITALKLPPAWTDVQVSGDPAAALQAKGRDAKGRVQSVYSKAFSATQAEAKFARVTALVTQFPGIQAQIAEGQASGNARTRDAADCLSLIAQMGIRPGSDTDTGADKKAYGATTLKGEHVVQDGDDTYLKFVGKKGVALDLKVPNPALAANLSARAAAAGADGALFGGLSDKSLLEYTHTMGDGSFKSKDFRTHLGTKTATDTVATMDAPTTAKEYAAAVRFVATKVSKILGNTPIIAEQSYINPTVFSKWSLSE